MMRALLGLTENPLPDAADALAIALTHAQNTGVRTKPKEI
jgi:Holliday junction resolvasome RuvABC endonuclease subunit